MPTVNETQYCEVGHHEFQQKVDQFRVPGNLVETAKNIYYYVRNDISYQK